MPPVHVILLCAYLTTFPASGQGTAPGNGLNSTEQQALSSANNISARSKVYLEAAGRHLNLADKTTGGDEEGERLKELAAYGQILEACKSELLKLPPQKRKDLKRQEITLRRYLSILENMEAKVGIDDRQPIQEAIRPTRELRHAFLDTFFGNDVLKKP